MGDTQMKRCNGTHSQVHFGQVTEKSLQVNTSGHVAPMPFSNHSNQRIICLPPAPQNSMLAQKRSGHLQTFFREKPRKRRDFLKATLMFGGRGGGNLKHALPIAGFVFTCKLFSVTSPRSRLEMVRLTTEEDKWQESRERSTRDFKRQDGTQRNQCTRTKHMVKEGENGLTDGQSCDVGGRKTSDTTDHYE